MFSLFILLFINPCPSIRTREFCQSSLGNSKNEVASTHGIPDDSYIYLCR